MTVTFYWLKVNFVFSELSLQIVDVTVNNVLSLQSFGTHELRGVVKRGGKLRIVGCRLVSVRIDPTINVTFEEGAELYLGKIIHSTLFPFVSNAFFHVKSYDQVFIPT